MGLQLLVGLCIVASVLCDLPSTRKNPVEVRELISCLHQRNLKCLIDSAENFIEFKRDALLAEADELALQTTGRSNQDNKPSSLTSAITELMGEFSDLLKSAISGFFGSDESTKEGAGSLLDDDDDDEEEVQNDDDNDDDADDKVMESKEVKEEGRKKKKGKIKRLVAAIKLLAIGAVIKAKITTLLKILAAHMQFKFLLIALASLAINAARFYIDIKKGHSPQKVIYYEHAQHQHHYEGGEDDWFGGSEGSHDWGRAYDVKDQQENAQNIAYAQHKPSNIYYEKPEEKGWMETLFKG